MPRRPPQLLRGPHPVLPRPLDAASERWWAMRPRSRTATVVVLILTLLGITEHRVRTAEARWGGEPRTALVATAPLPVGATPSGLRPVRLPPQAVPPTAVRAVPDGAVLAFALPEGGVLTAAHLHSLGPAAGIPPGLRAVPVPVEEGWGVVAGGWVDVWVLGAGEEPASRVAAGRPVLDVRDDEGALTALLALDAEEVGPATGGLALGRVLLTHAPRPAPERAREPAG